MRKRTKKQQKGFTLVELAVVMVIIGILLGAILKGQQMIDNARGKRVFNDMKGLEALLWTYYDRRQTFPGDCDGDGVMGVAEAVPVAVGDSAPIAALDSTDIDPTTTFSCATAGAGGSSINSPIADLREEQLLPWGLVNSEALVHVSGGQMRPTSVTSGTLTRNAIIIYDIPHWMGEMIDANIDGEVSGVAGRVRYFAVATSGNAWPVKVAVEKSVAILYLFDKPF